MHFFPGLVFTYFILKCNLKDCSHVTLPIFLPLSIVKNAFLAPHSYEFKTLSYIVLLVSYSIFVILAFVLLEPFCMIQNLTFSNGWLNLFWLISNATFSRNCLNSVYLVLIHLPTLYLNVIFHTCGNYRKPRALSILLQFSQIILQSVRFQ